MWGFGISSCTDLFTKRFPLGLYLGLVLEKVKGMVLLLVIPQILVVIVVKGSVQEQLLMSFRIQILSTQRRGDGKDCAPFPPKERGGEVGVPRNLFPRLGVG